MKNSRFGLGRRIAVALGALALTATGVAGAANATEDPSVGNINPATVTSLTIHKHSGAQGKAGNGTKQTIDNSANPALKGVGFDIQRVQKGGADVDLSTYAGWDAIAGVKTPADLAGKGLTVTGTTTSVVTGDNGSVKTTLAKGLYLVTETTPGSNNIASKAAPFLVTLPLSQNNGSWLYDVHVYPKNQLTNPTKEVAAPTNPVIGSEIVWTINADVPKMNVGDKLDSFIITDTLDSRLSYKSVEISGYTVNTDYSVAVSGQTVTITFLDPASLPVGKLPIKLATTVDTLGNGVIENEAVQFVNDPNQAGDGIPTTKPKTNWGKLEILKYAEGDKGATLSGAEFTVYTDAAATNAVGTITTGADGKGEITLWAGNDAVNQKAYWIKETKAPAGFILDSKVHDVEVVAGATASHTYQIANTQQDHPELPLTGANGQMLLIIGGSALVLLAAGSALVVNRRRQAAQR